MDNRGPRCARGMGGVGEEPLSPSMAVPSEEAEHHTSPLSPRRWQTSCHCLQLWKAARPTVQELGGSPGYVEAAGHPPAPNELGI